jgi:hypothetical protein
MKYLLTILILLCAVPAGADFFHPTLTWTNNATDAEGLIVSRVTEKRTSEMSGYEFLTLLPANATTYVDLTAKRGVWHCYRVEPYNQNGKGAGADFCTMTRNLSQLVSRCGLTTVQGVEVQRSMMDQREGY